MSRHDNIEKNMENFGLSHNDRRHTNEIEREHNADINIYGEEENDVDDVLFFYCVVLYTKFSKSV